jgi:hypothetical protein
MNGCCLEDRGSSPVKTLYFSQLRRIQITRQPSKQTIYQYLGFRYQRIKQTALYKAAFRNQYSVTYITAIRLYDVVIIPDDGGSTHL